MQELKFDSVYAIKKAQIKALGGDDTLPYDSVYSAEIELLRLLEEGGGGGLKPEIVDTLPEVGEEGKIYFVPNPEATEKDNYKEFIWVNDAWECVGNADVDLTEYALKTELPKQWFGTQAQYDALSVIDASTTYYIYGEEAPGIPDAPEDGSLYGRKDGEWEKIEAGGGGIEEAPEDGSAYMRQQAGWVAAESIIDGEVESKLAEYDLFDVAHMTDVADAVNAAKEELIYGYDLGNVAHYSDIEGVASGVVETAINNLETSYDLANVAHTYDIPSTDDFYMKAEGVEINESQVSIQVTDEPETGYSRTSSMTLDGNMIDIQSIWYDEDAGHTIDEVNRINIEADKITFGQNNHDGLVKLNQDGLYCYDEEGNFVADYTRTGFTYEDNGYITSLNPNCILAFQNTTTGQQLNVGAEGIALEKTGETTKWAIFMQALTQAEYDALQTKDSHVLYIITDAE